MQRDLETVVRASGIVPGHLEAICRIAKQEDTFMLFRPVNPNSTSLIAEGFGTKGLDIHSKSSDWGPQAGFICENQLLSKADTQAGIDKGNSDSSHSLHDRDTRVGRFPLIVTAGRVRELTDQKRGNQLFRVDGNWDAAFVRKVVVYPTKAYGSQQGRAELGLVDYKDRALVTRGLDTAVRSECEAAFRSMIQKLPALGDGQVVVYRTPGSAFAPVFALGYLATGLPVTADYDIFAICPNFGLSAGQFKKSADPWKGLMLAARHALGHAERNRVDPQMGRITTFQQKIKMAINEACNGVHNPVVHHGTEMDNTQFPEQDQRITVVTPGGGVGVTANWTEVQNVAQDIIKLGYVFYRNRCYAASEQQQDINKGKKFYFGQGQTNPAELAGNGKSFVWNPEAGANLKVLSQSDAKQG